MTADFSKQSLRTQEITKFDLFLRKCYVSYKQCVEGIVSFAEENENGKAIIMLLVLLIYVPFLVVYYFFEFLFTLPFEVEVKETYSELHPYLDSRCEFISSYEDFVKRFGNIPFEENYNTIEEALNKGHNVLTGYLLRDKMSNVTNDSLLLKSASKDIASKRTWYYVSFGNELNKALFCFLEGLVSLKTAGFDNHLVIWEGHIPAINSKLQATFENEDISIKLT